MVKVLILSLFLQFFYAQKWESAVCIVTEGVFKNHIAKATIQHMD
jgi:hypothetical protein